MSLMDTWATVMKPTEGETNLNENMNALPLPPIVKVKGRMFPTYPEMLKTSKQVGKIFTYLIEEKRITIITDKAAYRHVFFAKDSDEVELDSAKLAHHWFGIEKSLARDYTRPGLDKTREAMAYGKMKKTNEVVGKHALKYFQSLSSSGQLDLWDIAMLTFIPVVQELFGKETFPTKECNKAANLLWEYDEDFKKVANGVPRKFFPLMEKKAEEICGFFMNSIDKGLHLSSNAEQKCPVLRARLSVVPEDKYTTLQKARFVFSVFWASQGNTIPGLFWMLCLISTDSYVLSKLQTELRTRDKTDYFNFENCNYLQACVKETLRLKVANITLRNVKEDIVLASSEGMKYRVPKNDEITVASFVQHHDEDVYQMPFSFCPERWLDKDQYLKSYDDNDWFPFGAGTNKCSGRHLAQLELATVAGLFFEYFNVKPVDEMPVEVWKNCVAMVSPSKRSFKVEFNRIDPNSNL